MAERLIEQVCPRDEFRVGVLGSLAFAALTAVCAQIAIPLGFTPVPVTLQVLAVLLSGLALGSRWGAVSMMQYLALGAVGLPIFAEWKGGPAALFGPTAGYLIGFVPAAFVAGWVFERLGARSRFAAWLAGVTGVGAIYLCGASWLSVWMAMFSSSDVTLRTVWLAGAAPFIGIDLIKALAASGMALAGRAALAKRWLLGA